MQPMSTMNHPIKRAYLLRFITLFFSLFMLINHSNAADTSWLVDDKNRQASIRVRAALDTPTRAKALLDINLAPGWKTYWRSPGQGGIPLSIDWDNVVLTTTILWTVPQSFDVLRLYVQGYTGQVTLPITIEGEIPDHLTGTVNLSLCEYVCLIVPIPISLTMLAPPPANFPADLAQAMLAVPSATNLYETVSATMQPQQLQLTFTADTHWQNPSLFIDTFDGVEWEKPVLTLDSTHLTATIPYLSDSADVTFLHKNIHFLLSDGERAQNGSTPLTAPSLSYQQSDFSLLYALGIAFLGGLILNIMPCVLPVMGMKLGTVLYAHQHEKKTLRWQFIATSIGIITSFWVLALIMMLLRFSGQALSWGVQFQSPWFIGTMMVVTALFSANLLGVLNIYLPGRWSNTLASQGSDGLGGHFLQGVFATLLATPCSAPFLGTAIAVALVAPLPQLWIMFTAIGLGMSLPWILIAGFPQLIYFLPKPGRWMVVVKILLGVMMLLSSLWLLWLLMPYIRAGYIYVIGLTIITLLFIGFWKTYHARVALTLLLSIILGVFAINLFKKLPTTSTQTATHINWQPLSEAAIQAALAENKRVFVDVTADWCITCKINEINVFRNPAIQSLLSSEDVVALRGDWTTPSPAITDFLNKQGAFSVPFTQIYSPHLPKGETLSPFLTISNVITLMNNAKGNHYE